MKAQGEQREEEQRRGFEKTAAVLGGLSSRST